MISARQDAPFVLLEDRLQRGGGGVLYHRPRVVVRCDDPAGVADAFIRIEAGLGAGLHAAGYLSYELGHLLEPHLIPLLPATRDGPLLWFGLFDAAERLGGREIDDLFARCAPPPPLADLTPGHDRAGHVARVGQILARIAAGDIYQANLTVPIHFRYDGDPLALYAALRAAQPVAHGGIVATSEATILSVSPELLVRIVGDRAEARPMKGTVPRGADAEADDRQRAALPADPKQRAENLMIVDLLRNDLARIGEPGSVAVPALFTVETYPSFHTLTSTVTARLRAGTGLRERIAALFPCGSVVGTPKIRAAEVIAEVEDGPRGVYTGSIGAIAPNGDLSLNVAIRTAVLSADGKGRYGVGGGIVADSDPDAEYDEAMLKARILTELAEDYRLIETLRWGAATGFVRLDAHLARLARSAAVLGFVCDIAAVRARLARHAGEWRGETRARLTLGRDGSCEVTSVPLASAPARADLVVWSRWLDAADPFLRHKTTRRAAYDAAFAEAEAAGCDEALLVNHRGEIADASRNTVFALIGGRLLTPPVADGALPGVLRDEMIASGDAVEASLTLAMLRGAEKLMIGNSLHGLRAARLADPVAAGAISPP